VPKRFLRTWSLIYVLQSSMHWRKPRSQPHTVGLVGVKFYYISQVVLVSIFGSFHSSLTATYTWTLVLWPVANPLFSKFPLSWSPSFPDCTVKYSLSIQYAAVPYTRRGPCPLPLPGQPIGSIDKILRVDVAWEIRWLWVVFIVVWESEPAAVARSRMHRLSSTISSIIFALTHISLPDSTTAS